MKHFLKIFICTTLFTSAAYADPPDFNLSFIKKDLKAYQNSGEYNQDISSVTIAAKSYVDKRWQNATAEQRKHFAIVYDIDETAISNYSSMVKNDFGGNLDYLFNEMAQGHSTVIQPTLDLYNYAASKGIAQFFITGRPGHLRASTEANLRKVGYANWIQLYMKPESLKVASAADYKAPIRQQIEQQGYDVILSIGDQCSDLSEAHDLPQPVETTYLPKICAHQKGAYEDAAFKLPNPYYYIP